MKTMIIVVVSVLLSYTMTTFSANGSDVQTLTPEQKQKITAALLECKKSMSEQNPTPILHQTTNPLKQHCLTVSAGEQILKEKAQGVDTTQQMAPFGNNPIIFYEAAISILGATKN